MIKLIKIDFKKVKVAGRLLNCVICQDEIKDDEVIKCRSLGSDLTWRKEFMCLSCYSNIEKPEYELQKVWRERKNGN